MAVLLLGGFEVSRSGGTVAAFESDKVRALLAYLIVESGYPHRRDTLAALFWPDSSEARAKRNLNQAVLNLREAIGDREIDPPFLFSDRQILTFNPHADYTLDIREFERLLAACTVHNHADPEACPQCMERRARAVDLYRGDFLRGLTVDASAEFDEWSVIRGETLREAVLEALAYLGNYHEMRWEMAEARRYAYRLLALDPWREQAHLQLMRIYAHNGEKSAALKQYERLETILEDEFGAKPGDEARQLHRRLTTSPPAPPIQLPSTTGVFVGRKEELAQAALVLARRKSRLLTITGPGGVGKTALAVEIAHRIALRFLDGVFYVQLAALDPGTSSVATIVAALNLQLQGTLAEQQQLVHALRHKNLLLLLDGCEHVPDVASVVEGILRAAPEVRILVTSRTRLNLPTESTLGLKGLVAPSDLHLTSVDVVAAYDSVQLFVQRAAQLDSNFVLDETNMREVVHICQLVEGLPLAIELSAGWVHVLSCAEIAEEIEAGIRFLSETPVSAGRSLQAVFDRSWRLLSSSEQHYLAQLSLFRGGFTRSAAREVTGIPLSSLAILVDHSFIHSTGAGRYQMHELFRQFAAAQLEIAPATVAQAARDGLIRYYLDYAVHYEGNFLRLEEEADNLLAAMRLAYQQKMWSENMRFASLLASAWFARGRFADARRVYGWASEAAEKAEDPQSLADTLINWGRACIEQCDYDEAQTHLEKSLSLYQGLRNEIGTANTLYHQGRVAIERASFVEAQYLLEESREKFRQAGDEAGMAKTYYLEADIPFYQQDYREAAFLGHQALAIQDRLGDLLGTIRSLGLLADIALKQGKYQEALDYCIHALRLCEEAQEEGERSVILYIEAEALRHLLRLAEAWEAAEGSRIGASKMGDRKLEARALWRLSVIDADRGLYELALTEATRSDEIFQELEDTWSRPYVLRHLGDIFRALDRFEEARTCWQEALTLEPILEHPEYELLQNRLQGNEPE